MNPTPARTSRSLLRDVAMLQLKLLLDALRDVVLSPLTLAAALLDFAFSGRQAPRYFHFMLRLGERSDEWIDLWSAARPLNQQQRENVDVLLARVEEMVNDPQMGARRARVLKRWAERQMRRARDRIEREARSRIPPDNGNAPR